MKTIIIMLLMAFLCFSLDKVTIPFTAEDGGSMDFDDYNSNNDTLAEYLNRVVDTINLSVGNAGVVRCDSGSFPCTLHIFGGAYSVYDDTIGYVRWIRTAKIIHLRLYGVDARVYGGALFTYSFPDSLKADTTWEARSPIIPYASKVYGTHNRIEFNYPLEAGAGSGYNVTFFGDTVWLNSQEINYMILR